MEKPWVLGKIHKEINVYVETWKKWVERSLEYQVWRWVFLAEERRASNIPGIFYSFIMEWNDEWSNWEVLLVSLFMTNLMWMWRAKWAPTSQQLILKQGKWSPAAKVQGNNKFFIMNLKDNKTWKFALWLQHMCYLYFSCCNKNDWQVYEETLNS